VIQTQTALEAQENLRHVVARWPELRRALIPSGAGSDGMPRGESERLPLNVHVSDLMHEIAQQAEFYAHVLLEETDDFRLDGLEMPGLLAAVAERHGHFTADDEEKIAFDFCDWAHEAVRKVDRALEKAPPVRYLGACRVRGCSGEIHAREGVEAGVCPECGEAWTMDEQRAFLAEALAGRLATTSEIVTGLKVAGAPASRNTVRQWIKRKRLVPAIDDEEDDSRLYSFADAYALATRLAS